MGPLSQIGVGTDQVFCSMSFYDDSALQKARFHKSLLLWQLYLYPSDLGLKWACLSLSRWLRLQNRRRKSFRGYSEENPTIRNKTSQKREILIVKTFYSPAAAGGSILFFKFHLYTPIFVFLFLRFLRVSHLVSFFKINSKKTAIIHCSARLDVGRLDVWEW